MNSKVAISLALFLLSSVVCNAEIIQSAPKSTLYSVTLDQAYREKEGDDPFIPIYQKYSSKDNLKITYHVPYEKYLENGGPIIGIVPSYTSENIVYPLNFNLANSKRQIKYATSVNFIVRESSLSNTDLIYLHDSSTMEVIGRNVGWSRLKNLKASYVLVPINECLRDKFSTPVQLKIAEPKVIFSESTHDETFSWKISRNDIGKSFNKKDQYACVTGFLDFLADGKPRRRSFITKIIIGNFSVAPASAVSATYNLYLEAGKSNYDFTLPIHNYIPPNSVDRFIINMYSNRSAKFVFEPVVIFTDGLHLELGSIDISYFRPKGNWGEPDKGEAQNQEK